MKFTTKTIARSLADYLAPVLPGVTFYEDPNQQGSEPPCLFLQQRYNRIKPETGGFWRRTIGLDLTYLLDYNRTDLQQLYQQAVEALDQVMETFPYQDGETQGTVLLRTYDREGNIDQDAMHYKFEIRPRVFLPTEGVKMQTMDYSEDVTDGSKSKI